MESRKLRVCHVGPGFDMPGGMTKVIERIISSEYLNDVEFDWLVSVSKKNKLLTFIKALFKLIKNIKKYDVIHVHMSEYGSCYRTIFWVNIAKLFKRNVIVHSHGSEFEKFYENLRPRFIKSIFVHSMNLADQIIVLTPGWSDLWKHIVAQPKVSIIPNFVKLPNIDKKMYLQHGVMHLIFVGYIGERKGTYDLIQAVELLVQRGVKNISLTIVGNGEKDRALDLINELNLGNYVSVSDWLDENELNNIFSISDLLILPSYYESFGIVIIEAMSYKVPVIVGDNGYSKELLGQNTGAVVTSGNIIQLADEINNFIDIGKLVDFGSNGYALVKEKYSEQVVTQKLKDLYYQISKKMK